MDGTFAEFRHIVIQDGSSFAIHDGLREVFPGRFKVVKPAAVKLHTTPPLLQELQRQAFYTIQATGPEPAYGFSHTLRWEGA